MIETLVKRNGKSELFDANKINSLGEWAVEGTDCSWPLLVTTAVKKLYEGCTTKELIKAMIDSANDMIEDDYDWQYVAAKLCLADIRKEVFGSFNPITLKEFYKEMVHLGRWKSMDYSDEDLDELDKTIDHFKDESFTYSGIKQVMNKYLVTDLTNNQLYETPQFMYMGVAMAAFEQEQNHSCRLKEVSEFYHAMSDWVVNVPTPQLRGLRTYQTGLASCCLIEATDTLDSIDAGNSLAFKMTAFGAGIGYSLESRSLGDSIRNGQIEHGGKLPYYRNVSTSVLANVQPGRGGSATVFYKLFDPQIETLLHLKSDKVSEAVRIKPLDYCLQYNTYLLKRYASQSISLFSLLEAPEVYEAFSGKDLDKFIEVYEAAEKRLPGAVKVNARGLFDTWSLESVETGRIYGQDIHESNRRSTFKEPVKMSNLCLEVLQPTGAYMHSKYLEDYEEHFTPEGLTSEVSLCTLLAYNIDKTADLSNESLERLCYLSVKYLDNLIDLQSYPYPNMEMTAKARRNLGMGFTNLAGALANREILWCSEEARTWTHKQVERVSFFNHMASVKLAKERGPCKWYDRTMYSEGQLPIDTYKPFVDTLHCSQNEMPWYLVREGIKEFGIRHSVLDAQMPCESSSQAICSTNGAEPVRRIIVSKKTEQGINKFVAPYAKTKWWAYQTAWDTNNKDHISLMAVIQKFMGMSISTNTYYNYSDYPEGKVPLQEVIKDRLWGAKCGIKTWYYTNTDDVQQEECDSCSV